MALVALLISVCLLASTRKAGHRTWIFRSHHRNCKDPQVQTGALCTPVAFLFYQDATMWRMYRECKHMNPFNGMQPVHLAMYTWNQLIWITFIARIPSLKSHGSLQLQTILGEVVLHHDGRFWRPRSLGGWCVSVVCFLWWMASQGIMPSDWAVEWWRL